jgi:uridylate kinase
MGEALNRQQYGIDPVRLAEYAEEIKKDKGIEICHCNRRWNIFRELLEPVMEWTVSKGHGNASHSYQRNGFARCLRRQRMLTRLQTALKIEAIAEPISKEERYVTLRKEDSNFGAGTGNLILQLIQQLFCVV